MRRRIRVLAFALTALFFTTACSPQELALYLSSTEEVRDVLSNEELHRLRMCESTDNYEAISSSGTYRGAYQFDQTTWDGVAERHFPWLEGLDPITVEPWWQDAMTRALWSERGKQPWPICGYKV
ncbi:MAG: transglycosylase family protein [Acidimicrobiales bacterium]|nr:transglycosylase family protein [Acidimicrobiales bacterium]